MKVKIWGARGSTPAPLKPEAIREKIVSAILKIANLEEEQREALFFALSPLPHQPGETDAEAGQAEQTRQRRAVESYLDRLSPLASRTAGGNTPCIQIQSGNDLFIIDAGSGIRDLGLELMNGPCGKGEGVIHLLFSHPHWDHIQGFPFFRPAFIPGNKIFIYGVHDMEAVLRRQQEFISFPISLDYMQATKTFIQLKPNEVLDFGDLRIRNICNQHPGDAYSFRFEKGHKAFVYASDASYPDSVDLRPYLNFFTDADLLIFDSQFTQRESDEKEDWGHSSSFMGVEMAQQAKIKNLLLFHYAPTYSDLDLEKILEDALKFQQNQYPESSPVNILIAQEGQLFDLTPPQTTQITQVPGSKVAILKPSGIFDEHVAMELKEQLAATGKDAWPSQLIIDMTLVEMLQVAGLRALVKLRKEHQGTPMALAGPSINVQQLIELAGYIDFFAIYPSVHVALNALKARETLNLPGQVLNNRYKIESKIGDGRMGTVFKAVDTRDESPVAIKILSPSFSEGAIEQFLKQARQIINLNHPNIVNVYDCDEDRGISFMAEEYFEGGTLQDLIDQHQDRPLPFDAALSIAQAVARALEYSHTHGVVHGDLKPENVLLAHNTVKISDFGLGRLDGGKALINIDLPLALASARYLAPEQMLGHPIDARTDLYALGVILYQTFTGSAILEGSDQEPPNHHSGQLPVPPRRLNPKLSRSLEHLILKLLDKDPTKRYATARQVRHILNSMAFAGSCNARTHPFTIERWPPLVGRKNALQQLTNQWAEARQGRGQLTLIKGDSGIGKTRLTQELAYGVNEGAVLIGDCSKIEGSPAYGPFISAVKTYFDCSSSEQLSPLWQKIARLVPETRQFIPETVLETATGNNGNASPDSPDDLSQTLAQATAERPLLLIIDNLHWADSSSLNLFNYLAQLCKNTHLMLVGTYNNAKLKEDQPLAHLLNSLEQRQNCATIALEPLTTTETQTLLESIWSRSVPSDLVTAIYNHTKGNPLFAETIAHGLTDEGVVSRRDEAWHFGPVMEAGLPQNISDAILRRVNSLSRETQTLLNQAAILGTGFKFEDLHELSDLSEWDALDSLDIALERQLLKEAVGEGILRFSTPEIQQVLYNGLSALKQRLLHREAGEAMERRRKADPEKIAELLAHHFLRAGELDKGLTYSSAAAKKADTVYGTQTALYWYSQTIEATEHLDRITGRQRFSLLLAREQLFSVQGNRAAQLVDLKNLQTLAQQLNKPDKQAIVHQHRTAYEYGICHISEAATEAKTGLIAARQVNDPTLEIESLIQLATIALYQGQFDTARDHLSAAQNHLVKIDSLPLEAKLHNCLGKLHQWLGAYAESRQYYQKAVDAGQRAFDRYGQAVYLSNLGDLLQQTGDFNRALLHQQHALAIAQITGNRHVESGCFNRLAALYTTLGDYTTARSYFEQAKALHRQIDDERGLAITMRVLSDICLATGDYVLARDYAGQALEIFQRVKNRAEEVNTWLALALALEHLGDQTKACQVFEQVQDIAAELGTNTGTIDARAGTARCLLAEGKTKEAHREIEACLETLSTQDEMRQVKDPIGLCLSAYNIFQAANAPDKASAVLEQGYNLLQARANSIDTPRLKNSLLGNVPANKELLDRFKQISTETAI